VPPGFNFPDAVNQAVTVMQEEQLSTTDLVSDLPDALPASMPECCGTGCTVCVLDYPEYFLGRKSESEMSAMLKAIEQAQRLARQMAANQDGDL
jgi:hypothetical protein